MLERMLTHHQAKVFLAQTMPTEFHNAAQEWLSRSREHWLLDGTLTQAGSIPGAVRRHHRDHINQSSQNPKAFSLA